MILLLGHVNCRSILNKGLIVEDFLDSTSCDIFGITEIHMKLNDTPPLINKLTPPNYTFDHIPHMHAPGGDVGILVKNTLRVKRVEAITVKSFEHIVVSVLAPGRRVNIVVLYRPTWILPPAFSWMNIIGLATYLSTPTLSWSVISTFSMTLMPNKVKSLNHYLHHATLIS